MSNIEYAASVTVALSLIGFLVAWESESNFGKHLRYQTRLLGWLLIGVATKPIGWMLGAATLLAYPFLPQGHALVAYHQRRVYMPRHH